MSPSAWWRWKRWPAAPRWWHPQVGGLAFLVQDGVTGFVVPDGDPVLLADRLEQIILQPELRQRLGEQAAAYAQAIFLGENHQPDDTGV